MSERPNILVLMSDEQRWDSLGCNGNRAVPTPTIDALAERGSSLQHPYATYPLCCPSRMSIWTGLMPHDHHGLGNWRHLRPDLQDRGLIHAFAGAGYQTIYNGKWHVPGLTPVRFGFADVEATPAVLNGLDRGRYIEPYRDYVTALGYDLIPGNIENLTPRDVATLERPNRAPCGTAEIAIDHWLEPWQTRLFREQLCRRPAGSPFFAVCSWNAPHFPMMVPEPYDRIVDPDFLDLPPNFRTGLDGKPAEVRDSPYCEPDWPESEWRRLTAHYLGFCALLDDQVAAILRHLEAAGDLANTIVVYTSDHGDMMGSHGLNRKGFPLLYEEALRVPLVIAGPGIQPGARPEALVSLLDLVPTLADLAGVSLTEVHAGHSFAPALRGDTEWRPRGHVIAESFKVDGTESGSGTHIDPASLNLERDGVNLSIRTPTHRYIWRLHDHDELYDLRIDPGENHNIASDPAVEHLRQEFRRVLAGSLAGTIPHLDRRILEGPGQAFDLSAAIATTSKPQESHAHD